MGDEYERLSNTSQISAKGDEAFAKRKAGMQKNELNEQLKEYITQWRDERSKEEDELKRLKEKQSKRKEIRAEQEKELARKKKEEEDLIKKADAEKKALEAEAKKKAMEGQRSRDKKCLQLRRRREASPRPLPWMLARSSPSPRSRLKKNAEFP